MKSLLSWKEKSLL